MKKLLFITFLLAITLSTPGWIFVKSATTYDPTNIGTGLQIWWDTNDNTKITAVSGKASQINDKSGNGNNAVQATAGNRPTITANDVNGQQCFTFTKAATTKMTTTMAGGGLTDATMCALIKPTTFTTGNGVLTGYISTGNWNMQESYTNTNAVSVYSTSVGEFAIGSANSFNTGTAYWFCMVYNHATSGGTVTTYLNNVQVGQSTSVGTSRGVNASLGWMTDAGWNQSNDAEGCDVVVYNNDIGSTARASLYTNFAKPKFGLP